MSKTYIHDTFVDLVVCEHATEILVEVEFTVSPVEAATWMQPEEGGEVEIIGVRLLAEKPKPFKPRTYLDSPTWLLAMIEAAIDTDDLAASVLPDEGPDPDDARDRRIDEALMYGSDE